MKLEELKRRGRERAMQAYEYQKQGIKNKEICAIMGISRTRVNQLVYKAERLCEAKLSETKDD